MRAGIAQYVHCTLETIHLESIWIASARTCR